MLNVNRKTLLVNRKSCTHANHVEQLFRALRTAFQKKINMTAGLTAKKLAKLAVMAGKATGSNAAPMNRRL
jgi:hypothetical protein